MSFNFSNRMKKNDGFTLIEVIVSLIVAAILGTMLVTFMSTSLSQSVRQVFGVKSAYDIGKAIENITADYKSLLTTSATPLAAIKTNIGVAGGSTVTNAYGSYKVINNDYITFNCTGSPSTCTASNGGTTILKVTIADPDSSQTITTLLTQ